MFAVLLTLTDSIIIALGTQNCLCVYVSQAGDWRVVFCPRLMMEMDLVRTNVYGTRADDCRAVVVDSHKQMFLL